MAGSHQAKNHKPDTLMVANGTSKSSGSTFTLSQTVNDYFLPSVGGVFFFLGLRVRKQPNVPKAANRPAADGRNPFRTLLKPREAILCWYLRRGIIRNQAFSGGAGFRPHPQYVSQKNLGPFAAAKEPRTNERNQNGTSVAINDQQRTVPNIQRSKGPRDKTPKGGSIRSGSF